MATSKQQSTTKTTKADNSENILFIFAYFLTWLSGIIVYITEGQKNARLKFHAMQAIIIGVVTFVLFFFLWFIPFVNILGLLVWLYGLYVGYMAYQGTDISIPVIGDFAKQYSK